MNQMNAIPSISSNSIWSTTGSEYSSGISSDLSSKITILILYYYILYYIIYHFYILFHLKLSIIFLSFLYETEFEMSFFLLV